jgi:hypothetical protein
MDIGRIAEPAPAFDAREEPFDAWPVAADPVTVDLVFVREQFAKLVTYPESVGVAGMAWVGGDPGSASVLPIHRHKVFGAGEDGNVGFFFVFSPQMAPV